MKFKLGKLPARPDAVKFKLSQYMPVLPTPPEDFGHEALIQDWGMLGNDSAGDCVWAGAGHETKLWWKEAGNDLPFDDKCVLGDYSALSGYDPNDQNTDRGTDMQKAAEYRRMTGIADANGIRHHVIAYLAIDPTDLSQLYQAMYLFGGVGLGIRFPNTAMDQFNAGQPWGVAEGARIEGGHYVPLIAKRGGQIFCVTWGKLQPMTPEFISAYADEAIVYLTAANLIGGRTLEGFDLNTLQGDLAALR